jgi:hypothetical protein
MKFALYLVKCTQISHFDNICALVSNMKHNDRETDMTSSLHVHYINGVQ